MGGGFHRSSERATEEYEYGVGRGRSSKEMKEEGFSTKKGVLAEKLSARWFVVFWLPEKMNGVARRRRSEVVGEDGRSSPEKMTCYRTNKFHDTLNGRL